MDNGDYYQQWDTFFNKTTLNPIGIGALVILIIVLMSVKRERMTIPFVFLVCFIPAAQRIVIGGMDFDFMRILIIFAWSRFILKREYKPDFHWGSMDKMMVVWVIYSAIIYTIQYGSVSAFFNRLGDMVDVLGMYFLFRQLITTWEDMKRIIRWFCIVAPIVAFFFLIEKSTGRNPFSFFGGVPEFTQVREGRLRCQGAFSHPILAGCFWASLLPFMVALFLTQKEKLLFATGIACSLMIIVFCASSTPILSVGFGIIGGAMYIARFKMKWVRLWMAASYVALDVSMKAPVWHLMARMDAAGGSTGFHRFLLIDNTIKHWKEWFVFGTHRTAQWGHQMFDITNTYIAVALNGGFMALVFFIIVIGLTFSNIGKVLWQAPDDNRRTILTWALGVSVFIHMTNYLAVSYFGYIQMLWFLSLAVAASLAERSAPAPEAEPSIGAMQKGIA